MMETLDVLIELILDERQRQDEKWGEQNHAPEYWLAILMEEVGEAAKAVVEEKWVEYQRELVQAAAVAVAALECIDRQASSISRSQTGDS